MEVEILLDPRVESIYILVGYLFNKHCGGASQRGGDGRAGSFKNKKIENKKTGI